MSGSTFTSNSASLDGGGLDNFGTATVSGSTFTGNSASNDGGGLFNAGTATVSGSSFTSNSASYGGGLNNVGTATVSGSSFTSNSASRRRPRQRRDGDGERQLLHQQLRHRRRRPRQRRDGDGERQLLHQQLRHLGGGLDNVGTATVSGSTFTGNSAPTAAASTTRVAGRRR